jgi:zinc protease
LSTSRSLAYLIAPIIMAMLTISADSSSQPFQSEHSSFVTRGVHKTVLPNGLTVITKEIHDKPVVATVIWYRVGSKNEELGQTGKSHFLEHMLFKGTDRYKKGDIDLITLKNGGANNAFTWLDYTAYYFTFASDRWQVALDIEANRMRHTTFAPEEFDPEKKVVEEELHIGLDGPWEPLENEVWATAFRQHPYHWPTVGWISDLERTTASDMKAYYDKWYHPRNATLVIAGDFNTDEILAKIKDLFGAIPAGPDVKPADIEEPQQKGEKRVVVKKATPVERLLIGYHAPAVGEPDSYALHVTEALLSNGRSSRLYKKLVDQDQSVTAAQASFEDHIDPTLFTFQAELKPGSKLERVEASIYHEIDRIKNEPIPATELDKAKRQIEADLVLANEEPLAQAVLLGQYQTIAAADRVDEDSRGYKYLDTLLDRVRAVTVEDVARVARKYFVQDNRTVGYLVNQGSDAKAEAEPSSGAGNGSVSGGSVSNGIQQRSSPSGTQPERESISGFPNRLVDRVSFRTGKTGGAASASGPGTGRAEESQVDAGQGFPVAPPPTAIPAHAAEVSPPERADSGSRQTGAKPKLDVERRVLPNGLVLLLSENHSIPSVSIKAYVHAGSRFEPDDKAGLASLVGELVDEGTNTKNSQQIAEAVESVGGKLDTFGEYQYGGLQGTFLSKDLPLALNISADLLMNSSFPEDRVKLQIERRVAQIKSRLDVPSIQASDTFNEIVFKGHPEHRPAVGYAQTVAKLSRQDMVDFFHRYYVPNNTVLVIVGDIDKASVAKQVDEIFGGWHKAEDFGLPVIASPTRQSQAVEKFVTAEKEQVNIFVGHLGIKRENPDYYTLLVFDTILGSSPGFTSRIPRILRDEQGLAYTTYSNITGSARLDPGRFVAYIGTSPQNLDQALGGLRRQIRLIVSEPVSADELEGAKEYLTGNFVFDFQTNSQIGQFLMEAETYKLGYDYLESYPARIRAVTVADVKRVAEKYIDPDHTTTVVVGPVGADGKLIKSGGSH